jgi:hypothetical protein
MRSRRRFSALFSACSVVGPFVALACLGSQSAHSAPTPTAHGSSSAPPSAPSSSTPLLVGAPSASTVSAGSASAPASIASAGGAGGAAVAIPASSDGFSSGNVVGLCQRDNVGVVQCTRAELDERMRIARERVEKSTELVAAATAAVTALTGSESADERARRSEVERKAKTEARMHAAVLAELNAESRLLDHSLLYGRFPAWDLGASVSYGASSGKRELGRASVNLGIGPNPFGHFELTAGIARMAINHGDKKEPDESAVGAHLGARVRYGSRVGIEAGGALMAIKSSSNHSLGGTYVVPRVALFGQWLTTNSWLPIIARVFMDPVIPASAGRTTQVTFGFELGFSGPLSTTDEQPYSGQRRVEALR